MSYCHEPCFILYLVIEILEPLDGLNMSVMKDHGPPLLHIDGDAEAVPLKRKHKFVKSQNIRKLVFFFAKVKYNLSKLKCFQKNSKKKKYF